MGRIWIDLDLVWHLEPKTPTPALWTPLPTPETLSSRSPVKESCTQDLVDKNLLSLHSHKHYMAFILIYIYTYMVIFRKRRREWSDSREDTATFGISGKDLALPRHLRVRAWLTCEQRQAPVHATPFLVFLNTFRTLKSSEMCIRFIGIAWNPLMHCFPWYPYLYRYFCEVSKYDLQKCLALLRSCGWRLSLI
jgi:hypothetical protein